MSMTENEAKELLDSFYEMDEMYAAAQVAIKALEEIQQYRAIGTVEGYERAIQTSIENYNLYREYKAKVQEFEAIGTVEECRVAVEIVKKMHEHCEGSCADCPYHNPNIPDRCMNDLLK